MNASSSNGKPQSQRRDDRLLAALAPPHMATFDAPSAGEWWNLVTVDLAYDAGPRRVRVPAADAPCLDEPSAPPLVSDVGLGDGPSAPFALRDSHWEERGYAYALRAAKLANAKSSKGRGKAVGARAKAQEVAA